MATPVTTVVSVSTVSPRSVVVVPRRIVTVVVAWAYTGQPLPRRRRVREALRAIADRWTWVRPAFAIRAAARFDFPCRRRARYTSCRDR
jgi:hypothetical protein